VAPESHKSSKNWTIKREKKEEIKKKRQKNKSTSLEDYQAPKSPPHKTSTV
jgi:hypothetical protein